MSELFTGAGRALFVYHLMYGKAQTTACPMCTMWIDGLNGVAHHVAQNADFVVVAGADLAVLRAHGRGHGRDRVRLLSCGDHTFRYDLRSEDDDGSLDSTVSVFTRDGSGAVRHVYRGHPWTSDAAPSAASTCCAPCGICPTSRPTDVAPGTRR